MTTALSTGIRRVATRLAPDPALTSDGELLTRFLASRDEAAFAALVRRHAPMVFGTCRRVLGNASDADDAFQAAFVVLVRRAESLAERACVGNFLYGVAFHTALKAKAMATKRRVKESRATTPTPAATDAELTAVLDEELARLPEKYREPVVLCELEGVSRRDAAGRLGVPEGTISSRLATAHRMLEKRLRARGFAAVAIAAVLGRQALAVSDTLADAAVRAAVAGPPSGIAQLVTEVTKMFLLNKLRTGVAVLAGVALLLGVGIGVVQRGTAADEKAGLKAPVPAKQAEKKDEDRIQGLWEAETVQVRGKQVPAAQVYKLLKMRFGGNTLTTITEDGEESNVFVLDAAASPKKLATYPAGKPEVKKVDFIYDLDGDTLKLCHNTLEGDAGALPTSFRAGPQDKDELIVFKRVKDEKEGAKKPDEPAWKAEFRKAYGLTDGQLVRRVAPPYPDCRDEYLKSLYQGRAASIPFADWFAVLGWKGEWADPQAGQFTMPVKPDEGVPLERLLDMTLRFPPSRIESDRTTLDRKVTGDFVVRVGAAPEKAAGQLEAILRKELELPVKFSFKDAEEEVFVLSGKYAAKPLDGKKAGEIEVYATYRNSGTTGGGGGGTLKEMAAALERHVNKPVVLGKVEGEPKGVRWHFNDREKPFTRQEDEEDRDAPKVLFNVAEQTGLTVTPEKRKVRVLVVQHDEVKK